MAKRIRIFAGPNGSGKSTVIKNLVLESNSRISLGAYVNADDIERSIADTKQLDFREFKINVRNTDFQEFVKQHGFASNRRAEANLYTNLIVKDNILHVSTTVDSYLAADVASFIRAKLVESGISFTFETVLSHSSKIQFIDYVRQKGYRVYLYYVATALPAINHSRVKLRVALNGHAVSDDVITRRYHASLAQLKAAVKLSDRAYIFDNSESQAILLAAITDGNQVVLQDMNDYPEWFVNALLKSNSPLPTH